MCSISVHRFREREQEARALVEEMNKQSDAQTGQLTGPLPRLPMDSATISALERELLRSLDCFLEPPALFHISHFCVYLQGMY